MQTRIRELRKRRGLTLQQLAQRVGTTAQTVQRLETANMTVSMDWLGRFADAFSVRPRDLLLDERATSVPLVCTLGQGGAGRLAHGGGGNDLLTLDVPAEDPVAVRLDAPVGPYPADTLLVGNRLAGPDLVNAHGHDCIVSLDDGRVLLRRLLWRKDSVTLVPIDSGGDVRFEAQIDWAARLVMLLRYF